MGLCTKRIAKILLAILIAQVILVAQVVVSVAVVIRAVEVVAALQVAAEVGINNQLIDLIYFPAHHSKPHNPSQKKDSYKSLLNLNPNNPNIQDICLPSIYEPAVIASRGLSENNDVPSES